MSDNGFIYGNGNNNQNDPNNSQPSNQTYSYNNTYNQENGGYNYGNQNNGAYTPPPAGGDMGGGEPPKKKRGMGGIIAAVAATGVIAGALVTGFVVVPALNANQMAQQAQLGAPAQTQPAQEQQSQQPQESPAQQTEAPQLDSAQKPSLNQYGSDTTFGGAAAVIQNQNNPVPEIAESAKKSVVGVKTYNKTLVSGQEPVEEPIAGGSGFVISNDGYILTNNHVISSGNLIKVVTDDGQEYVAELVGKDSSTELAVLKVEGLALDPLPIGNSDESKTGELVVAIGNPLSDNLQNTVTVGYLSAESRQVLLGGEEMTMLQTDAAINPGNSGGPLLNAKGEVIGINTMKSIFAGTDGYGNTISAEGIGFSIPINKAMEIAQTLIRDGSIAKPGIGFTYTAITAEDAELWGTPKGILVQGVNAGSPAQKSGLKVNDIITEIDGVDLTAEGATVPKFSEREVGEVINASVWRDGTLYQAEFTLADLSQLKEEQQPIQQMLPF